VRAGVTERWSNGPTEGFVHKLKLAKRQAYCRAGLALVPRLGQLGKRARPAPSATHPSPSPKAWKTQAWGGIDGEASRRQCREMASTIRLARC